MKKDLHFKPKKFDIGIIKTSEDGSNVDYLPNLQIYGHASSDINLVSEMVSSNLHKDELAYSMKDETDNQFLVLMILGCNPKDPTQYPIFYFICDDQVPLSERDSKMNAILESDGPEDEKAD